ncbi:hypothetical protein Pcinc_014834 [Petrolisthes cinctipes]|uniref:Uncharacterized protein n=1 Tax=Petrolisthes cinctipes TaxID=88211 RepID=A0AAE1FVR1_PETCI|nr:hypothetical protein Pcinc_014834 [Petrolisthes cinctipes]
MDALKIWLLRDQLHLATAAPAHDLCYLQSLVKYGDVDKALSKDFGDRTQPAPLSTWKSDINVEEPQHYLQPWLAILLAKFEGPYEVMEKCGSDRYVISTPGRRKAARKVHANNMKLFHHRQSVMTIQGEVNSVQEEDNFIPTVPRINNSSILNNLDHVLQHLRSKEREDVKALLLRFPEILQDVPQQSTNHRDGFYRLANNAARMIIMKARGVESGTVIQSAPQIRLRPGNRDPG